MWYRNPIVASLLMLAVATGNADSEPRLPSPKVVSALDGIFTAFQSHPLVGMGDEHGLAQQEDFYAAIVRDPRFAKEVGNLVVEFGGAAQQATIDRYVNGESVSYPELRKVWTDVVGWVPTVSQLGFINLYASVRSVNMKLPPEQRIKVWLGEPRIDWSQIKTKEEWRILAGQRDTHPAELIQREILEKGKKALVIYGNGHLGPAVDNLRSLVSKIYPDAFFVVLPYFGYFEKPCSLAFERGVEKWSIPSLAMPVKGTTLETALLRPGCNLVDTSPSKFPPEWSQEQRKKAVEDTNAVGLGLAGHALLYLGPQDRLSRTPSIPDIYLDQDFRQEIDRRFRIIMGRPLDTGRVEGNPATSRPFLVTQ